MTSDIFSSLLGGASPAALDQKANSLGSPQTSSPLSWDLEINPPFISTSSGPSVRYVPGGMVATTGTIDAVTQQYFDIALLQQLQQQMLNQQAQIYERTVGPSYYFKHYWEEPEPEIPLETRPLLEKPEDPF